MWVVPGRMASRDLGSPCKIPCLPPTHHVCSYLIAPSADVPDQAGARLPTTHAIAHYIGLIDVEVLEQAGNVVRHILIPKFSRGTPGAAVSLHSRCDYFSAYFLLLVLVFIRAITFIFEANWL